MAIISNGTTVASGGNLEASRLTGTASAFNGSNITSLPSSAPSSATAIGSHGLGMQVGYSGGFQESAGGTTSSFRFINVHGNHGTGGNASGTWRRHGSHSSGNDNERSTVYCRIS